MHVAELAAMAFVKNDDNLLVINLVLFILLDKGRKLLDCCDDNVRLGIRKLSLQDRRGGVAVCGSFLKAVIFLHGLVIQILTVNNEEHLIDEIQIRCNPCRLK